MRWCVFCGSQPGYDPRFAADAHAFGVLLAQRGIQLVYGGGRTGIMGVIADAMVDAGGHVIGIIPQSLEDREVAHRGIADLRIVGTMHERKALMAELADGFVALPGGFGTYEEFCEAVTWTQLSIHDKPCILANLHGFYDPLVAMFDRGASAGFISAENRRIVRVVTSLDELIAAL